MSDVRKFTALAVASRAHGYTPKRTKAGDPQPLHRTHCCSDFLFSKESTLLMKEKQKNENRSRNVPIGLRVSEKELAVIDKKKDRARMTRTDYLIACAMGKQITLMEDLKPLLSEMKRVGNNLNQLTKLANMGRITEVNLIETWEALNKIYVELHRLVREKGGDGEWQSS